MSAPVLTNAPLLKKAFFDLLKAHNGTAQLLDGVDVRYAWEGDIGRKAIYGGGWRTEVAEVVNELPYMVWEVASVSMYVQDMQGPPPVEVEVTDAEVGRIAGLVGVLLTQNVLQVPGFKWLGIGRGLGDYGPLTTDDEVRSQAAFEIRFGSIVTWG